MILYLDSSAFLKLYLEEPESRRVQQTVAESAAIYAHLIAYAEIRAGLAQAVRTARMPDSELSYQVNRFESDWTTVTIIAVDERLVRRAGILAEQFGLRAYDSVHLAAAARVFDAGGRPAAFCFAAFDNALAAAAAALGLKVLA